jgi:hypothetical protein
LRDRLQILDFSWAMSWDLTLSELTDTNTKEALMLACTARRIVVVPQCSNVQFSGLDAVVPRSRFVSISFDLAQNNTTHRYQLSASLRSFAQNNTTHRYQLSASLRSWAGNLLNETGDSIVSDDD